jgi:hypothetical protein
MEVRMTLLIPILFILGLSPIASAHPVHTAPNIGAHTHAELVCIEGGYDALGSPICAVAQRAVPSMPPKAASGLTVALTTTPRQPARLVIATPAVRMRFGPPLPVRRPHVVHHIATPPRRGPAVPAHRHLPARQPNTPGHGLHRRPNVPSHNRRRG